MLHLNSKARIATCTFVALVSMSLSTALAQDDAGRWEITLAGAGASNNDFDATQLTGDLGLGVHIGPFVTGVRQSVTYNESSIEAVDDFWSGSTRGFLDLEISLGPIAPFIGGHVGYVYGDLVDDQFIAGPEGGLKWYVGDDRDAFIFVRAEYQFFFEDSDEVDDAFEDGQWVYALGIGLRF